MAESILSSTTDALTRRISHVWRAPPHPPPALISQVVEAELIPRLQRPPAATRAAPACGGVDQTRNITLDAEAESLAGVLLKQNIQSAWKLIQEKYTGGMNTEQLAIDLLGGAARYLGTEYAADRCSFAEVTVCTGYLHQLLRQLYSGLDHGSKVSGYHHRILLLPAPGEQHILGLSILGESFRRRGWDVSGGPTRDRAELLDLVKREHFDAIGFSIGADRWLSPLADELQRLRRSALNPAMLVLVGGHLIDDQPGLVDALGADFTVGDARLAANAALTALREAAATI